MKDHRSSSNSRSVAIDALKGISIIGVLCIHANFQSRFDEVALAYIATLKTLFAWAVLGFFYSSGFAHFSHQVSGSLSIFIRRRAMRLLSPCVILSVGNRILIYLFSSCGIMHVSPARISPAWLLPIPPQFYFLPALLLISSCAEPLRSLPSIVCLRVLTATVLLSTSVAALCTLRDPHGPELDLIPIYGATYSLGAVFGLIAATKERVKKNAPRYVVSVLAFIAGLSIMNYQVSWMFVPPILAFVFSIGGGRAIISALALLGRRSGMVFLWHDPLLMPVISLLLFHVGLNGIFAVLAMLVLTIWASLLLGSIVARYDRWHLASF